MSCSHAPGSESPDSFSEFKGRSDYPKPGSTYVILHHPTNRALSIIKGNPILHHVSEPKPGVSHPMLLQAKTFWHWECVYNRGWLSFRNAASGKFLGHDGEDEQSATTCGSFRCTSTEIGLSERFAYKDIPLGLPLFEMGPDEPVEDNRETEPDNTDESDNETLVAEDDAGAGDNTKDYKNIEEVDEEATHDEADEEANHEEVTEEPEPEPELKIKPSPLYSLLARSQNETRCRPHGFRRCAYCDVGSWKVVKVQVKPESLAEGKEEQVVWDAKEDAGTVWRFVEVVPMKVPKDGVVEATASLRI